MLKGILLACGAFGAFLPLHLAIFHLRAPHRRFGSMVRLHASLALGLIVAYAVTPPDVWVIPAGWAGAGWLIDLANGLLVHSLLFAGYSMFYFLVDRGFSARILIEIERAPGQALTPEEVAAIYSLDRVVARRLDEMVDIGSVIKEGDRYRMTARGRREAQPFAFLKSFFRLGPGG
ncbi:MAG: hypothetical protein HYU42_13600 [Candidatus Rokubacteria bacterium]|nr:hypothetical protein [Candidatus Rokubacteria bacterium]MBI2199615.1 hypothetical protein [Candidatus Rokubacteria bacterium]MBI3106609.1 hypothetical protein [Candidatus Rokubacteria bacterium]